MTALKINSGYVIIQIPNIWPMPQVCIKPNLEAKRD